MSLDYLQNSTEELPCVIWLFFFILNPSILHAGRNGEGQLDFKQDKYAVSLKIQPNKR